MNDSYEKMVLEMQRIGYQDSTRYYPPLSSSPWGGMSSRYYQGVDLFSPQAHIPVENSRKTKLKLLL